MLATVWGYAECYAILHRKRNGGRLTPQSLRQALTKLQNEVLTAGDFGLLSIEDARIRAGLSLTTSTPTTRLFWRPIFSTRGACRRAARRACWSPQMTGCSVLQRQKG